MLGTFFLSLFLPFLSFGTTVDCSTITAKHAKGILKTIELDRCTIGVGGASYDLEAAPVQHYWLSGKVFSGAVLETAEGYVYKTETDLKKIKVSATKDLPKEFNCSGKKNNGMQCMVCNCFFEARAQNFDEQVMVNRTVLSRVLSPSHPKSVCGVVHEKSQFSWTTDFPKYRVNSKKTNQNLILGERSKDLNYLDKQAFRKCVASSREAMTYDNEFFAAYYVSKKIKKPGWVRTCEYRSRKNKTKISIKDNKIGKKDLAHNFYRVCELKENRCLKTPNCRGGA